MSMPSQLARARSGRLTMLVLGLLAGLLQLGLVASPAEAVSAPAQVKALKRFTMTMEVGWTWSSKASSYQVQWSPSSTFSAGVVSQTVKRAGSRPGSGLQPLWLKGLNDATKYFVRVRSISGGAKSGWSSVLRTSTQVLAPVAIKSVNLSNTANPGEVKVAWALDSTSTTTAKQRYAATDYLTVTVASTAIDGKTLTGARDQHSYRVAKSATSLVLSAAQTQECGVGIGSGRRAFVVLSTWSVGTAGSGRVNSGLYSQQVRGQAAGPGIPLRVAQYNVASSGPDWAPRSQLIADHLVSEHVDVATMVELGTGTVAGLLAKMSGYAVAPIPAGSDPDGTTSDNRVLYDTSQFSVVTSGALSGFHTPLSDASPTWPSPTYALLQSTASPTTRFWVVSQHLPSGDTMTDENYRDAAMKQVLSELSPIVLPSGYPVLLGGDFNSSQTWAPSANPKNFSQKPHDDLMDPGAAVAGWYDTASAVAVTNIEYSSKDPWKYSTSYLNGPTQVANANGGSSRIDQLWTHGMSGADQFKVVVTNAPYPSDHNMIWADIAVPPTP